MIRIEYPQYLLLLIAVVLIAAVYFSYSVWRSKALKRLGEYRLLQNMLSNYSHLKSVTRFVIVVIAFILIVVGLANVQMGSATKKVNHSGIDIALLIDISNSMVATDAVPNRLEVAKKAAQQLTDLFPDSRITIIAFAGSSSTILPLSPDHAAAQMVLANLSSEYAQLQGTDFENALTETLHALPSNQNRYRAAVIFSDGEDHEHTLRDVMEQISQEGIVVCAAGIGTEEGSEIPLAGSVTSSATKRDSKGNIIITKLNSTLLKQIAGNTNGVYVSLSNGNDFSPMEKIAVRLNAIQKKSFDEKIFVEYESRFQYFLLPALMLLVAETFFGNRKRRKSNMN